MTLDLEALYKHQLNAAGKAAQKWARKVGWREPKEGEHLSDYLGSLEREHAKTPGYSTAIHDAAHAVCRRCARGEPLDDTKRAHVIDGQRWMCPAWNVWKLEKRNEAVG